MDRTWWREATTGSWRCGRRVTSNSFTSTQAVTQASVPWTSHTTRGKALWQAEPNPGLLWIHIWFDSWLLACSSRRTLITGMASGSIVAFNIDFNRWHYEHQNRYWGGRHEEEEDGEGRGGREGEEDALCCVSATPGKLQAPSGRKTVPDLRLYSLGKFSWREDAAALVEHTSSKHTCTYTHTCNHRHIISRWHTPQPAEKPVRLQTFRGWFHP